VKWRESVRGNSAVREFVETVMVESPSELNTLSAAEYLTLKSKPEESPSDWPAALGILGGGLGLGIGTVFYLLRRRRALAQPSGKALTEGKPAGNLRPLSFFIGREPGENGLNIDPQSKVLDYISRKQVEISFEPTTGKYFARHLGTNPTYLRVAGGGEIRLGAAPMALAPNNYLLVKDKLGNAILQIAFFPERNSKDPRSAFQVASQDPASSRLETRSAPPSPPAPNPEGAKLPSETERKSRLQQYQKEMSQLRLILDLETEGPWRDYLKDSIRLLNFEVARLNGKPSGSNPALWKEYQNRGLPFDEIQLTLEYAHLKAQLPQWKDFVILNKGLEKIVLDKTATSSQLDAAMAKRDSAQMDSLPRLLDVLRIREEQLKNKMRGLVLELREIHPFDLLEELKVLREERESSTDAKHFLAWQEKRDAFIETRTRILENALEYASKSDGGLLIEAIETLEAQMAKSAPRLEGKSRARLATIVHWAGLLMQDSRIARHHGTKAKIENIYRQIGNGAAPQEEMTDQLSATKRKLESEIRKAKSPHPFPLQDLLQGTTRATCLELNPQQAKELIRSTVLKIYPTLADAAHLPFLESRILVIEYHLNTLIQSQGALFPDALQELSEQIRGEMRRSLALLENGPGASPDSLHKLRDEVERSDVWDFERAFQEAMSHARDKR